MNSLIGMYFISYRFSGTSIIHDKRAWHISKATRRLNHLAMVSSMDREAYHNSRSHSCFEFLLGDQVIKRRNRGQMVGPMLHFFHVRLIDSRRSIIRRQLAPYINGTLDRHPST